MLLLRCLAKLCGTSVYLPQGPFPKEVQQEERLNMCTAKPSPVLMLNTNHCTVNEQGLAQCLPCEQWHFLGQHDGTPWFFELPKGELFMHSEQTCTRLPMKDCSKSRRGSAGDKSRGFWDISTPFDLVILIFSLQSSANLSDLRVKSPRFQRRHFGP